MPETTTPAAEKPKEPAKERDYVVLGERKDGTYRKIGTVKATTDKKAIAPYVLKQLEAEAKAKDPAAEAPETFVAFHGIPSRSWVRRTPKPKVETQPRLSW